MRHQWIIEMLQDLQAYALVNDLPQLAAEVAALLPLARAEIALRHGQASDGVCDPPPLARRSH